jgi:hypothetical protein
MLLLWLVMLVIAIYGYRLAARDAARGKGKKP